MIPRLPSPRPYTPATHTTVNPSRIPLACTCASSDGHHADACWAEWFRVVDGRAAA